MRALRTMRALASPIRPINNCGDDAVYTATSAIVRLAVNASVERDLHRIMRSASIALGEVAARRCMEAGR